MIWEHFYNDSVANFLLMFGKEMTGSDDFVLIDDDSSAIATQKLNVTGFL